MSRERDGCSKRHARQQGHCLLCQLNCVQCSGCREIKVGRQHESNQAVDRWQRHCCFCRIAPRIPPQRLHHLRTGRRLGITLHTYLQPHRRSFQNLGPGSKTTFHTRHSAATSCCPPFVTLSCEWNRLRRCIVTACRCSRGVAGLTISTFNLAVCASCV
jgi:hypothetical protein